MKNKKLEQKLEYKKRTEERKKSRRNEPTFQRNIPTKSKKPTILIVCEGENTEPSYFNQFKLLTATIKPVGTGCNTLSLVKKAKELAFKIENRKSVSQFDQVWCVFDADPKPDNPKQAQNFNSAINFAGRNNFGVAYSNQAFEYWIILHFEDHQGGGMGREDYNEKINDLLKPFGVIYEGETRKIITEEIFNLLEGIDIKTGITRRELAMKRAKRNYDQFNHNNPAKEESSTTVFLLVKELMKYL